MFWWKWRKLRSKHVYERCLAVEKLGESRDARAIEPLLALRNDKSRAVRSKIAEALGEIVDRRAGEALVNPLSCS